MRALHKLLPTKSETYRKVEAAGKKVVKPLHKSIHVLIVIIIFLNSCFISDFLIGEQEPTRMLFFRRNTRPRWLLDFLKRNFYFKDTKSALVMTVRLIFSSLLKDFILLIFGHGDIRERVKNLPEILEEKKVVDSYIDKPGARMRKKKQAIREAQEKLNMHVLSDSEFEAEHTFLYRSAIPAVDKTLDVGQLMAQTTRSFSARALELSVKAAKKIGLLIWTILRVTIISCSSVAVLVLYTAQLVIRIISIVYDIIEAVLNYLRNFTSDLSLVALHIIKTVTGENVKNAEKIPPSARRFSNAKSSSAEPDSTDSEDERPINNYEPSLVKEISKGVISYFHGDEKSDKNEARNEDQEANDNASLSSISEVDEPSQATGHLPPTVGQQVQSGSESESSAIKMLLQELRAREERRMSQDLAKKSSHNYFG